MNIVLLGDSLSKGILFDKKQSKFILAKDSFFNLLEPRFNANIINISKLGQTLNTAITVLDKKICIEKPDVVAIELGGNDCDFDWNAVSAEPDKEHACKTPFIMFENGVRNLIKNLKKKSITPVLINLPPIDAERYFRYFCNGDENMEKNVLSFLGNTSKIYWWHERYSSVLGLIAEETGTRFIDIRSAFMRKEDYRAFLCEDGIHPNTKGHKLIAEKIEEYLMRHYSSLLMAR